jgi:glyoxylase-like metal-dependent hydrolase (beta-lactamase superfamily II)
MSHTNEVQLIANQGWDTRILVCRNGKLVDTFIIVTTRYVVLVDTIINPQTAATMLGYAQPYCTAGRQLLVVNSHADYDHCWGNQLFAGPTASYPAPIIASRLCVEQFQTQWATETLQAMQAEEPAIFGEVILTPPTISFDNTLTIDGGDLTLQLLPAPGHTVDHAALYLPEINTLLAADAAEVPYPAARTLAGLPIMRQSLAQLAALKPTTALYCHAPVTIGPQLLHDNLAYFDRIEEACRTALGRERPQPADDNELAAWINLPFAQAIPNNEHWQNIHAYYSGKGHAQQIRMMLDHLTRTRVGHG